MEDNEGDILETSNFRQSAFDSFKKSLSKVEEPYKKKISDLERIVNETQLAKERTDGEIFRLRSMTKTDGKQIEGLQGDNTILQGENAVLQSENKTLRVQAEEIKPKKLSETSASFEAARHNKSAAEQLIELQKKYNDAEATIETLQRAQTLNRAQPTHTPPALSTVEAGNGLVSQSRTINGKIYEVMDGENSGFLQEADGESYKEGRTFFRRYTILREERREDFYFEGASSDELVQVDEIVQREVVLPIFGKRYTKQTLSKREDSLHDGGKEYVAFDVVEAYHSWESRIGYLQF